jgi:hypothetical protein
VEKYTQMPQSNTKEKKRLKFKELAEKRMNRALDSIRLIGNLSNRQNYNYDEAEARKIIKALKNAVGDVERQFTQKSAPKSDFKL